jgi:hypothetical protein
MKKVLIQEDAKVGCSCLYRSTMGRTVGTATDLHIPLVQTSV